MQKALFALSALALFACVVGVWAIFTYGIYNPMQEAIDNNNNKTLTANEFIWGTIIGIISVVALLIFIKLVIVSVAITVLTALK